MSPLNDEQKAQYKYVDESGRYRLIGRFLKESPIKGARDVCPEWEVNHPELVMRYYMKEGTLCLDYWTDIYQLNQVAKDQTGYPTQKPAELSKREIITINNDETGKTEEYWTGDHVFENEWQSFHTRKDRELELKTPFHECKPG